MVHCLCAIDIVILSTPKAPSRGGGLDREGHVRQVASRARGGFQGSWARHRRFGPLALGCRCGWGQRAYRHIRAIERRGKLCASTNHLQPPKCNEIWSNIFDSKLDKKPRGAIHNIYTPPRPGLPTWRLEKFWGVPFIYEKGTPQAQRRLIETCVCVCLFVCP